MTVKELIEHLQQFPQDKKVILRHDDHTDWTYTVELTNNLVDEDKWWDKTLTDDDYESMEDRIEDGTYEEDSEYEDVVMIYCKFWD
jgi:hypothetical protein